MDFQTKEQTFSQILLWTEGLTPLLIKNMSKIHRSKKLVLAQTSPRLVWTMSKVWQFFFDQNIWALRAHLVTGNTQPHSHTDTHLAAIYIQMASLKILDTPDSRPLVSYDLTYASQMSQSLTLALSLTSPCGRGQGCSQISAEICRSRTPWR